MASQGMLRYLQKQKQSAMVPVRQEYENVIPQDDIMTRYYKEFGAYMTPEAYENLTGELAANQAAREAAYGSLDEAESKLYELETDASNMWKEYTGGFMPVRVVNGSSIEGTYMLPVEVINSINSGAGGAVNSGDGSYTGNWVDDGKFYNIDVVPRGGDDAYGKELHEMMASTVSGVKDQFYSQANPQVAANLAEQEKWQKVIDAQRNAVDQGAVMEQEILDREFGSNLTMDTREGILGMQIGV